MTKQPASLDEEWRDVAGYEGSYQVSDYGRVRSLPRRDGNGHRLKGRILKSKAGKEVNLFTDGMGTRTWIARLVAEAFLGPAPVGACILHVDGNTCNHRVSNLAYVYPQQVSPYRRRQLGAKQIKRALQDQGSK